MNFKEYLNLFELDLTASTNDISFICNNRSCKSQFVINNNTYTVIFTKALPQEIASKEIDDVYEIEFLGPTSYSLTGLNSNQNQIYSKLLLTIKKFLETKNVDILKFSSANDAMDLIYHKFYKKYLSKEFLKIKNGTYIKRTLLNKIIPDFDHYEKQDLYRSILNTNRMTSQSNKRIQQAKIKFRAEVVKFKNSLGKMYLIKSYGLQYPIIVLGVGHELQIAYDNQGGVELKVLAYDTTYNRIYETEAHSFNIHPIDNVNENKFLKALTNSHGILDDLLTKYPNFKQIYDNWLSHQPKTESTNLIQFTTFAKDGTVVIYINGKKYTYLTDAFYHNKWKKMVPFSPWKVLNQIKTLVQNGTAELIN